MNLKMLKKYLLVIFPIVSSAQYKSNRKRSNVTGNSFYKRKKTRPKFIIGSGSSNFLVDLSGLQM